MCWWGDARHAGKRVLRLLPIIGVLSSVPWSGLAQETQELAKQAQNPITNLISVPLQHNFNFGVGPEEDLQYVLNIQPVIPVNLTKGWTLVTRSIIPVIYQPLPARASVRPGASATSRPSSFSARRPRRASSGEPARSWSTRARQTTCSEPANS